MYIRFRFKCFLVLILTILELIEIFLLIAVTSIHILRRKLGVKMTSFFRKESQQANLLTIFSFPLYSVENLPLVFSRYQYFICRNVIWANTHNQ